MLLKQSKWESSMKKFILVSVLFLATAASANALKCEGQSSDCRMTVYISRSEALQIYANECKYSDDNGGGAVEVRGVARSRENGDVFYFIKDGYVKISKDGTGLLRENSTNEETTLSCQ